MKITKIETIVLNLPMIIEANAVPHPGGRPRTSVDMLFVRIDTDEGVSGWGEASANRLLTATKAFIDTVVVEACVGRDPTAITDIAALLDRGLGAAGRSNLVRYATSAIDIALWDIAGKLAGLPLYRLLGGSTRKDLPAYASLLRYTDPATVARYTERALQRGFRHVKLHEITLPAIQAGRKAAGPDIPIMVDCNCAWSADEAIWMAHRLEPLELKWLEEPVWPPTDFAGIARVRREGRIATAAGENALFVDFFRMFEAGSLSYAQPSVARVGGVTEFRKVLTLAEAFNVEVVPHAAYFGPGLLATLHCNAAMAKETLVERYEIDFAENPMHDTIKPDRNGRFAVPQRPGLGVEPDSKIIEKFRVG
jgi:D-galactarolactone cycloisomerase